VQRNKVNPQLFQKPMLLHAIAGKIVIFRYAKPSPMDIPVQNTRREKHRLLKEFEYIDLIPYSICLLMVLGIIYFLVLIFRIFPAVTY
jgi:hypothetical protein